MILIKVYTYSLLTQLAQTDKEEEKRLTEEGYEFGQLILDANEITSDLNARIEEIEEKIERLRSTFDELEKHLRCLTALGEDTNHRHFVSLIMSKLPREVIIKLEEMKKPAEL